MADAYPDNEAQLTAAPARRKRRWPRFVFFTVAWLIVILVVRRRHRHPLAALCSEVRPSRHSMATFISLAGGPALSAPVTVRRDQHGVPHIDAATQEDMFVAQGYVTAQDRLWQMDAYRRSANGELAEIMGPSLLRHDKAQRMFQFRNTAHRIYANLPPEERARYDAYARGVNLYIAQHQDSLATRVPPTPLQAATVDRRRLRQHRHDDGRHARHALVHEAVARTHRGKAQQPEARVRSLPRRLVARPSAHRRTAST